MTSIPKKIPVATAVALALGATSAHQAIAQTQAGVDQKSSAIQAGPVKLTFGGFTELAVIYRNHNQVADVGSDFGAAGIAYSNSTSPQYFEDEFRESARQSRFSLLAEGAPYDGARAELYMETDFLSAGATSNSRESNSYTLRMRHFYGRFITDSGLDITAGQTWSLATLAKNAGMAPRDQVTPLTIDAQYVVGFNWTRNAQLRIVQNFSKAFAVGLSIESPQAVYSGGNGGPVSSVPGSTPPAYTGSNYHNPGDGAGLLNATTDYTTDNRPDVVLKAAFDPGWGHYEVYGLARWFTSNVATHQQTSSGGGVGAGMILPLAPGVLSFQLTGLVGKGIGRYGSGQITDIAERADGTLEPIKMYHVMGGLTLTPTTDLTVYAYFGREKASNAYSTVNFTTNTGAQAIGYYGFGSPFASTKQVSEVTVGEWWKFYKGKLGNAQFGLQGEYLQRDGFDTLAGVAGPSGNIFIGMASFRYYPYQN